MNPMTIMSQAEKLSVPELQRSIQSGVIPAFIGVPLLQEKVKRAKQMQMGMAAQQPKRPSVAEQVGQEARQASVEDMMRERARMMQGEMGQTGGISGFLPKPAEETYAKGGPIAFDEGGLIEKRLKYIREHGLAGTVGNAYNQAYGWSSDLAKSVVDPRTYQNIYSGLRDEYSDLDDATKKILWGVPDEPQEVKQSPTSMVNAIQGQSDDDSKTLATQPTTENILNKNALNRQTPDANQVKLMQERIASGKQSPRASFDFANPNQVATDVLANPARANTDPDLWQWAIDYREQNPIKTPYTQTIQPSAPAAQQAQPQQQEEQDLSLSDYMKQYREVTGENKGIGALQNRLSEREARLAKEEDRIPGMALMQAGIAMMAGTSSNAMTNIAHGLMSGSQTYINSMNKLEDAKDKSFDIQAKLEDAHRAEELAAAKYGFESVQADKKAKQVAQLEREKMANDMKIHEMTNAAHLEAARIGKEATLGAAQTRAEAYAGTGKPTKLTDQQNYFNRVVEALEANPTWRPDLRHADGSPNPIAIEAERKKTSTDRRMEGFMGDSMGTSMGSGMMSTQPDPRYRILSQQ
jgi:hypothetical protein